uniref:Uncharacterized protein n=1 Tax=Arundo donax TaxID=35708 RepID=A0A0A9DNJ8_ARUDO
MASSSRMCPALAARSATAGRGGARRARRCDRLARKGVQRRHHLLDPAKG